MVDISLTASPKLLIETEETPTTLTLQLSEPPPEGGLLVPFDVSIDSGAEKPLAQFNLNNFTFEGATLQGLPNTDTLNSFTLLVTEQTANINLVVGNDEFDEGTDEVTFAIRESEDFDIVQDAGSTTLTIQDEVSGEGEAPEPPVDDGGEQGEGGEGEAPEPPVDDGGEQGEGGEVEVPTVSFDLVPDSLNEEDGGNLSLNFTVDGDVPEEGITLNLNGVLDAVLDNQFALGDAEADGLEILSPGGEGGEGS
ncbi:MAG: hypothetical protein GVY17_02225, partial [Cyanobacteria bacterium]|nr:hypothetical protein [Cyanobacteria bacterium GSL.Bin21]